MSRRRTSKDSVLQVQTLPLQLVHPSKDTVHSHYRRFNNSIIHFRDDLYLMTYRLFLPPVPPKHDKKSHEGDDVRYHPWRSQWNSRVDQPILTLLRYDPASETFSVMEERPLHYLCPKDQAFDDVIADARLMWFQKEVYAHGNGWGLRSDEFGAQQKRVKTNVMQCSKGRSRCELAVEMLLKLEAEPQAVSEPNQVHEIVFPCLNSDFSYHKRGSDIIEKNWSFFEVDGEMYMEYTLGPHVVARIDMASERQTCNHPADCTVVHKHENTVFERIVRAKGGGCYFSPGGSPIRFNEREMLNVGHVKYDFTAVELLPVQDRLQDLRMHPAQYVYLMFVYTFATRPPFELMRVSHAFIPSYAGNPYALVFAMGIAALPRQKYVISYGEGDSISNLLTLSKRRLNRMLLPVEDVTPDNYRFEWLPAKLTD